MIPGLEKDKGPWKEISSVSVINATPAFLREFLWSVQPLLQVRWPWDYTKVVFYFFFFFCLKNATLQTAKNSNPFSFEVLTLKTKAWQVKIKIHFFFFNLMEATKKGLKPDTHVVCRDRPIQGSFRKLVLSPNS